MKTVLIASTLALATLLQGCATRSYSNGVYTDADTQRAHSITPATVMAVRAVTIERATNGMGAAVGGNVGTALGGAASKSGNGQFFAAVLGGAAGNSVSSHARCHEPSSWSLKKLSLPLSAASAGRATPVNSDTRANASGRLRDSTGSTPATWSSLALTLTRSRVGVSSTTARAPKTGMSW